MAVAGKGGVGKTTTAALMIQWLTAHGRTPVLAVDADSNANLNEALGIEYTSTVGGIREEAREKASELAGIAKQEFMDIQVQEALVEQSGYDLIVMGRPEGPGCYCFANNILRDVLKRLSGNYASIVVDSEAGLEHISRRTLLSLDLLCLVSDCTVRGVRTARRVAELAAEMGTPVAELGLIVIRVPGGELPPAVRSEAEAAGLPILAVVPVDENVAALDAGGFAVGEIPADSPARTAINDMLERALSLEGSRK
ncbi:MAG: ATP-binding protein [Armatimonadota bacterium]